jgi:hypothetical protein
MIDLKQSHCGYYLYNGQYVSDRETLLDLMIMNNDYDPDPALFHYNDEVFESIDWTKEPSMPLKQMYIERAKQLRDQYDYLILGFSGGTDSNEILEIFLNNNIFIDEIQTVHYEKLLGKLEDNYIKNHETLGVLYEYKAAVIPKLKKVRELSPNTKINSIDLSDYAHDQIVGKKFDYMGMKHNPTNGMSLIKPLRIYNYYMHTYNNQNQPKKAKTAFIRGFEKPWLFLKDEELIFRFSDIPLHGAGRIRSGDVDDIYTLEDFFWTPNYPLIPVKQSHVIKNVFMGVPKIYERFKQLAQSRPLNSYDQEAPNELDRVYARYIYSYSNQINFIAPKPKQNPELFLMNKIENQENAKYFNQLIEEKKDYYLNRYRNVVNQNLLKRHWVTKGYFVFNMNNVIRK